MQKIRYPEPPSYLLTMPRKVLLGTAKGIERWCKANQRQRPTLLDLESARREVR